MRLLEAALEGKFMLGFITLLGSIVFLIWLFKIGAVLGTFALFKLEHLPVVELLMKMFGG